MWSPTVSEDGKTSPYMEPDSQVTAVYSGFSKVQVVGVVSPSGLNSRPQGGCQDGYDLI